MKNCVTTYHKLNKAVTFQPHATLFTVHVRLNGHFQEKWTEIQADS